jgi:hypothetical protein
MSGTIKRDARKINDKLAKYPVWERSASAIVLLPQKSRTRSAPTGAFIAAGTLLQLYMRLPVDPGPDYLVLSAPLSAGTRMP